VDGVNVPLPDDPACPTCREYASLSRIPLRVRSAANPGGIGHLWVKKRFDIGPVVESIDTHGRSRYHQIGGKVAFVGRNPKRPFVPAVLEDNPYLDQKEYRESLRELDPVTREQLLSGNWSITSDGRFKKSWARYYSTNPPYYILGPNRQGQRFQRAECQCFQIVDPAASAREGPGDTQVFRGAPSWTVVSTFLRTPNNHLLWLDLRRFRREIPDIYKVIKQQCQEHGPSFIGIEASGLGIGLYQLCNRAGLPVKALRPASVDKLVRATDACNRMERGMIWLPQTAPWLEDLEAELFTWTGHPHEQDDQIDVLAYAAMEVSREAAFSRSEDSILPAALLADELRPDIY
jgi:predicted phage terminase large subunit-like protein